MATPSDTCPKCGATNLAGRNYCPRCGSALPRSPSATPTTTGTSFSDWLERKQTPQPSSATTILTSQTATNIQYGLLSNPVLLLGICFFGAAALSYLLTLAFPPASLETVEALIVLNIIGGAIAFFCWVSHKPDYTTYERPLGITLIAVEEIIAGVILAFEGFILLFLPILGLVAVFLLGIGLGLLYLGRALWQGQQWSQSVLILLTFVGLIVGIVAMILLTPLSAPILTVYQLWYLRRPHVNRFFLTRSQ